MAIKRVYVVHRNPALQHHEFAPRWKQHSELAQTFPELVHVYPRLTYCCTLEQEPRIPGASRRYDGVGMLWLRSDELVSAQPTDPRMRPVMQADELRVFRDKMLNAMVTVDEEVRKDGRGARFGLISFLRRKPGTSPEVFLAALRGQADAVLAAPVLASAVHRYVMGSVMGNPTYACEGVVEMWFNSAADAVTACNTPAYSALVLDAQNEFALPDPLTLLTEIGYAWSAADDPDPRPHP
jgi:hypothetical protein